MKLPLVMCTPLKTY